jgi:putative FmdB family regulatory protein
MPLYEYYCADCQHKFDTLRPMNKSDDPIQCKNCAGMQTSRVISLFAAHVKGKAPSSTAGGNGGWGGGCACGGGGCGCGHHH